MGNALTRVWRGGVLEAEGFPVADVSEYLERPDTVVWVDFCGPSPEQLRELESELGLHELAVEDALGPHQRPKLDSYDSHWFLSCHSVRVNLDEGALEETEIDAFIDKRWLITVRKDDGFPIDPLLQRWDRSPHLAALNCVSFLLYGLMDVVVDQYFEAIEAFDDYYETVSDSIFADRPLAPEQQRHWFEMRRAMVRFHRLVVPVREVVSALMRREHDLVPPELHPYYQDVYDHILRVSESSDSLRDLVATIVETNISLKDYRQNRIMKKVTSWAAIIAVPTLITGYYGMNVPYPGYGGHAGFVVSSAMIFALSFALYLLFRHRDWL